MAVVAVAIDGDDARLEPPEDRRHAAGPAHGVGYQGPKGCDVMRHLRGSCRVPPVAVSEDVRRPPESRATPRVNPEWSSFYHAIPLAFKGNCAPDHFEPRKHLDELFPRVGFIVTTPTSTNRAIVRFYNHRGTARAMDQGGQDCDPGVIAHNLGNLLRRLVLPVAIQDWSLTSLQQRLLKTGRRLIRPARYFMLQLAESYLTAALFRQILTRIERLAWHPT